MRRLAVAAGTVAVVALLAGCAPSASGPQELTVSYAASAGGEQSAETVTVPSVECDLEDARSSIRQPGTGSAEQGLADFAAVALGADADTASYNLILKLDEGLYFISSKPFEITADGLEVSDLQGIVSRFENGEAVENLDVAATVTASLSCP